MTNGVKRTVNYKVTYDDGSSRDFDIDVKFAPLVDDLLYRLRKLQECGTAVYETEKAIYEKK